MKPRIPSRHRLPMLAACAAVLAVHPAQAAFTLVVHPNSQKVKIAAEDYGTYVSGSSREGSGFELRDTLSVPISPMNLSTLLQSTFFGNSGFAGVQLLLGASSPSPSAVASFLGFAPPEDQDWDFFATPVPDAFFDYSGYSAADKAALETYGANGETIQTLDSGFFPLGSFEFLLVPEPSGQLLVGVAGLLGLARRRR